MKVSIVSVGNSRGVRLPKAVLEQCQFADAAELTVEDGRVVLTPVSARRAGWAEAFATGPHEMTDEDRQWLDAPLADSED
ncbi:MAG: AbrB/MazE/SpoVT family DNA-binding domain-containing protein [Hyphomonadaceae bacterium]|jgi:antitoxin MazE|nr:AbrB/MazE/SpoVT family DNA-binding domain-containing protein [Hyphomonadaceae bacterium]